MHMATTATLIEKTKTSPLGMFLIGALSIAALAASAKIQVPMIPVPITLQTAVVLILPCLLGWRMGWSVLAAYFAAGAMGLPVFAGALSGPAYFFGPTGGYLVGFIAAMVFAGMIYEKKKDWSFLSLSALMLVGHVIILALGVLWLAYGIPFLGLSAAIASGFIPFIFGTILKSGLAAAVVKGTK
jgi:biotin transport system substrate-specific component